MSASKKTDKSLKRKRGKNPLVDGELESAQAVTHTNIRVTRNDGTVETKRVLVSLDSPRQTLTAKEKAPEIPALNYEMDDLTSPPPDIPNRHRTQRDYIMQYVDRMDGLLEALLSREAMADGVSQCRHCDKRAGAVWRCKDCALGTPMCRGCMRVSHKENPFHRIEQWNGTFFRSADLWEVGTYVLVQHHAGEPLCDTLNLQINFLETAEIAKDIAEQDHLTRSKQKLMPTSSPAPTPISALDFDITGQSQENPDFDAEDDLHDEAFMRYLQQLRDNAGSQSGDAQADEQFDFGEREDELEEDEQDTTLNHYLPSKDDPVADAGCSSANPLLGTYLRVVHTNGIHNIAMVSCQCRGDNILPLDLLAARLLPASFQRIRTLFTAQVLDSFRLCNLELKASAYQFYQLLRRITQPMAPAEVLDLYREFRRMSRLWRWMKKLKWAGYGANGKNVNEVQPGELAIYCPACPQPNINIPHTWKDDSARQVTWVYKRIFVADGNFKADHVRQKNAEGDVWLSEGSGMFPEAQEYLDFLRSAIERLTKAPCENTFRAIMNSLLASKVCDVTGLVAIACGRHGCYAPNALVDLFKGEQQKNVDFAFLKALTSTHVDSGQGVLLIYDIACQYFVHLRDRIGTRLPSGLDLEGAIGLFHVHAHKDECFFRYAPSFIPGAGVVVGEILESLWSSLNAISPTARTATLAHRAEMLDDHATDSNHKKMLGMASALCKSHRTAVDMLDHAQVYFQSLTTEAGPTAVEKWEQDIKQAEQMRRFDLKAMDIYATRLESGTASRQQAPRPSGTLIDHWMALSLTVEEKQLEIQAKMRQLGRNRSSADRQAIEKQREALIPLILQLKHAQQVANIADANGVPVVEDDLLHVWDDIDEAVPESVAEPVPAPAPVQLIPSLGTSSTIDPVPIESQLLSLPSNGNISQVHRDLELSHRISLADHHLNRIRDLIAEKSFQYSHVIRVSTRKGVTTRSRTLVKKLNLEIALHCRLYSRCRSRLARLGADPATQSRLRILTPQDIKASTAIINPNIPGSTKLRLSWIWQTAGGHRFGLAGSSIADADASANADADENVFEFRRIHWLRARAQLMRWQEEVTLTSYEMQWTVRFFYHKNRKWAEMVGITGPDSAHSLSAGAVAYALRKQAMWEQLAVRADRTFALLNNAYKSPL